MNHQLLKFVAAALALGWVGLAVAAPDVGQAEKQGLNIHAIVMFFIFVMATLGITYWAAKRSQNGQRLITRRVAASPAPRMALAIAGDYMSAATLLGLTSLTYLPAATTATSTAICLLCGLAVACMFLIAERLRNLGKLHLRRHRLLPAGPDGKSAFVAAIGGTDRSVVLSDRADGWRGTN
jgi:cation/acetate symporter